MWFVAIVGALAFTDVAGRLPGIPTPAPVSLSKRLAPLGDSRVLLTLMTTLLTYAGLFLVYTYIGLIGTPFIVLALLAAELACRRPNWPAGGSSGRPPPDAAGPPLDFGIDIVMQLIARIFPCKERASPE